MGAVLHGGVGMRGNVRGLYEALLSGRTDMAALADEFGVTSDEVHSLRMSMIRDGHQLPSLPSLKSMSRDDELLTWPKVATLIARSARDNGDLETWELARVLFRKKDCYVLEADS